MVLLEALVTFGPGVREIPGDSGRFRGIQKFKITKICPRKKNKKNQEPVASASPDALPQGLTQDENTKVGEVLPTYPSGTTLEDTALRTLLALPPSLIRRVSLSLKKLVSLGDIHVGTCFSGCDILHHALKSMSRAWKLLFNIHINFELRFQCESDVEKQVFLVSEVPASPQLFNDAAELGSTLALNVKTQRREAVPWVFLLVGGFGCVDKSS